MKLAIINMAGLSPAGDLNDLRAHLEGGQKLSFQDFQGQCDQARLKELGQLLPGANLRRVPRLARLALRTALEIKPISPQTGLIVLSAYGSVTSTFDFLDSILNDGAELASPTAFSHSVTNMTAAYLSQYLGLTGPCLSLNQSFLLPALQAAELLLSSGRVESVLLGVISEYSEQMNLVEESAGRRPPFFSDGAVFFELRPPRQSPGEVLLTSSALNNFPPNGDEDGCFFDLSGSSCLEEALKLALACQKAGNQEGAIIGLRFGTDFVSIEAKRNWP